MLPAANSWNCMTSSRNAYAKQRHCHAVSCGSRRHGESSGVTASGMPSESRPTHDAAVTTRFALSNESMNASSRVCGSISSTFSPRSYWITAHAPSSSNSLLGASSSPQAVAAIARNSTESRGSRVMRAMASERGDNEPQHAR
jgi:hypothetical protein